MRLTNSISLFVVLILISLASFNLSAFPKKKHAIIKDKIEEYRYEFSIDSCDFIRLFPKNISLNGWIVRLQKGGHQTEHIHPEGWLSGVCYVKIPRHPKEEEVYLDIC